MHDYDYGPLQTYEITWRDGTVELVQGHQVTTSNSWGLRGGGNASAELRTYIHGSFDGHWHLVLSILDIDVRTIRNITDGSALFRAPAPRQAPDSAPA